jgi:hypothetical protein
MRQVRKRYTGVDIAIAEALHAQALWSPARKPLSRSSRRRFGRRGRRSDGLAS